MKTKRDHLPTLLLTVAFLGMVLSPLREAQGVIVERIAAVVNGRIILLSEVNTRLRPYMGKLMKIKDPKQRQQTFQRLQRSQLERLIEEKLILAEAGRRKLKVSEAEVNRAIKSVMAQNEVSYEELKSALKTQGYTMPRYKQDLRRQILRLKVLNMAVRSRISVSADDVKAFYQKQKRRLGVDLKVKIQLIKISVPPSGARRKTSLKKAYGKIRSIKKELQKNPEAFSALAQKHSDHPSSKKGGFMGYVGRSTLPPALERLVFNRRGKKGELLGPAETDDGVYLVQILDRQESEALPFDQIKNKLKKQIFQRRLQRATKRWLEGLRRKAYIDIKI